MSALLLGMELGLDGEGRVFAIFLSVVWALSGAFAYFYLEADPGRSRFAAFWILSLTGNLGIAFARDAASFYLFFALMTFSAYGLVAHDRTPAAFRAAKLYLVLAIAGEMALVSGLMLAVELAGSIRIAEIAAAIASGPERDLILLLFFAGFGVKAGLMPLHGWLPIAHPAAPIPASAVLSGCMIKAGLLGWLRFIPLGRAELAEWGFWVTLMGVTGALVAAGFGIAQQRTKEALAYSSVSQMGWMLIAFGVGLGAPGAEPLPRVAIWGLAAHHAVAKAILFLGIGIAARVPRRQWRIVWGLLVLAALSLSGAPGTGGAIAKGALKRAMKSGHAPDWLVETLFIATVATTALMARFLFLVHRERQASPKLGAERSLGLWFTWGAMLAVLSFGEFALDLLVGGYRQSWDAGWPVLVGAVLAFFLWRGSWKASPPGVSPVVPPGDVLLPIAGAVQIGLGGLNRAIERERKGPVKKAGALLRAKFSAAGARLEALEGNLADWSVAGGLFVTIGVILGWLLWHGRLP